jgi:hypothetical protein
MNDSVDVGTSRYLPLIESASCFRLPKTVGRESSMTATLDAQEGCPYEIQVDGIAELWFKSQAGFDAYSSLPATKRLRDDGATFIGREIDLRASSTPATFHGDDLLGILLYIQVHQQYQRPHIRPL